ncbi:LysM domain-containing protein [Chryseobacterium salipaludis]|uniref:LysM peptidoglycan-binding domain-containing protein n=1 Tax=Chryseobacterium TaxID=59732 RepID=UPI001FF643AC|nr:MULTISPECIES: LysM domain-containing protein [Chryseobacterium]MCJ8498295.1 LysM domain-containing protein [Chryseobacterium salipaludis]MCX3297459.1 LysM domain-containing protein [Planobacterium sp. JC490]
MKYTTYQIQKDDTLESIAEKQGCTVKQLVQFHNQHVEMTQQIYGTHIPLHIEKLYINDLPDKTEFDINEISFDQKARYRCEQSVMTYVGGILINHIDTKREFLVDKFQKNGESFVNTKLVENIMNYYPEEMKDAVDLISDIDLLACNLQVSLNRETGKIDKLINHNKIVENWKLHKENLKSKYGFLRNSETIENLQLFLQTNDEIFLNAGKLKEWVNNKMFFDLFFDKYLVNDEDVFSPFKKSFILSAVRRETNSI